MAIDIPPYQDYDRITNGEGVYAREKVTVNTVAMSSGILRLAYFTAQKTEPITQVRMECGAVAAGATPTLVRVGIWTADLAGALLALVGNTVNDTSLLATITTSYPKALAATWNKVAGTRYAYGLLVVTGATAPQVPAYSPLLISADFAISPRHSANVTGQTDLPASVAAGSLSNTAARIYGEVLP